MSIFQIWIRSLTNFPASVEKKSTQLFPSNQQFSSRTYRVRKGKRTMYYVLKAFLTTSLHTPSSFKFSGPL